MKENERSGYAERLKKAGEARKALLAKFQPKATAGAAEPIDRAARKAAELAEVRVQRAATKLARREAAAEALDQVRKTEEAVAAADLAAKRGERKERKALSKAEAKAKRDARYAARKARK
jgi:hypothetical protein